MTSSSFTLADATHDAFLAAGLRRVIRVREDKDTTDFAGATRQRAWVVRCAENPSPSDCSALQTMIAQGDFHRAILVCRDDNLLDIGGIEICRISDVEALAQSLSPSDLAS